MLVVKALKSEPSTLETWAIGRQVLRGCVAGAVAHAAPTGAPQFAPQVFPGALWRRPARGVPTREEDSCASWAWPVTFGRSTSLSTTRHWEHRFLDQLPPLHEPSTTADSRAKKRGQARPDPIDEFCECYRLPCWRHKRPIMRLFSLSAALFAAFAWTTKAAEEGEIKSVSVRSHQPLLYPASNVRYG